MADDVPVDSGPEKVAEEEPPKNNAPVEEPPAQPLEDQAAKVEPAAPPASPKEPVLDEKPIIKSKITVNVKTPKDKDSFEVDEDMNVKDVSTVY